MKKYKKILVTAAAGTLLVLLYFIIFGFSAQNAEESGSLSQMISEKCVNLLNSLSGRHWTQDFCSNLTEYFEHPIRKLAHFSEYACMGILVYVLWVQWLRKGWRLYLLVVGWVLVSAALDEFHQLFVPGRYGSLADVLLDTCGGAFGMLFCILTAKTGKAIVRKRKARQCKRKAQQCERKKKN